MAQEIFYQDAEFVVNGSEKIDYKTILFKQIDYIRFLRTNDMGDFLLFEFGGNPTQEMYFIWIKNLTLYKNSIDSFKILIKGYHDEEFTDLITKLNKFYAKKKEISIANELNKIKNNEKKNEIKDAILKKYSIIYTIETYDSILEECLMLIKRNKIIGGNDFVQDTE